MSDRVGVRRVDTRIDDVVMLYNSGGVWPSHAPESIKDTVIREDYYSEKDLVIARTIGRGLISTTGNIRAEDLVAPRLSGKAVELFSSSIEGEIEAAEKAELGQDTTAGGVISQGSISAARCGPLGFLTAKGFVTVLDCKNVWAIHSEGFTDLQRSVVQTDVVSYGICTPKETLIKGTLTTAQSILTVEGGHIDTIVIKESHSSPDYFTLSQLAFRSLATGPIVTFYEEDKHMLRDSGASFSGVDAVVTVPTFVAPIPKVIYLHNDARVGTVIFEGKSGGTVMAKSKDQVVAIQNGLFLQSQGY